jgi:hypothetical protein
MRPRARAWQKLSTEALNRFPRVRMYLRIRMGEIFGRNDKAL